LRRHDAIKHYAFAALILLLAAVVLAGLGFAANAAVVYTGETYTGDFDSIGPDAPPPANWIVGPGRQSTG
jgi:hypothetical protein